MWSTLYPPPDVLDVVREGTPPRPGTKRRAGFVVLPAAGGSRMLVPAAPHLGAAMAASRSSLVATLPHRALWAGLALGLRAGAVQAVFRDRLVVDVHDDQAPDHDDDLTTTLSDLFGEPVELAVHVGRARANRKPVVQVMDRRGRTLGFCKVAWNDITRGLLVREAQTLRELEEEDLYRLDVPTVLFEHHRSGLDHLVVSPLRGGVLPARDRRHRTWSAMREVARTGQASTDMLTATSWWKDAVARAESLGETATGSSLRAALATIGDAAGDSQPVAVGRWHGDWSPWNMTMGRTGQVLVWDWERSDPDVPVGFDGLHFALQERIGRDGLTGALERTRRLAPTLLAAFPEQPAPPALLVRLYLVGLSLRYAEDAATIGDPTLTVAVRDLLAALRSLPAR